MRRLFGGGAQSGAALKRVNTVSSVNAVKCYEYCSFTEIYAQIYRDRLPNETIYNPLLKILELYCHKFDMSGVFIRVKLSLSTVIDTLGKAYQLFLAI